jgi:hypothetical protein
MFAAILRASTYIRLLSRTMKQRWSYSSMSQGWGEVATGQNLFHPPSYIIDRRWINVTD